MNEKDGTKQTLRWTSKEKPPSWLQEPSSIIWLEREIFDITFNHLVIQVGPTDVTGSRTIQHNMMYISLTKLTPATSKGWDEHSTLNTKQYTQYHRI